MYGLSGKSILTLNILLFFLSDVWEGYCGSQKWIGGALCFQQRELRRRFRVSEKPAAEAPASTLLAVHFVIHAGQTGGGVYVHRLMPIGGTGEAPRSDGV